MASKLHKKQYVVFAVLITFLIGKVFDLHMHGHIESSHTHSENPSGLVVVDHHDELHSDKDTHVVSIMNDLPNILSHVEGEHGHKTFDIETQAIVEKVKIGLDFDAIYVIALLLLSILFNRKAIDIRPLPEFRNSFQQRLFTINHPLRAPPFHA